LFYNFNPSLQSLLNFILPDQFAESLEHLRAIFKVKGDAKVSLLSQERISRAKKMMTPFVLRRRKDQVRYVFTERR
jgi:SWI/SNF-related matrix-associated actin-dependent regulator 1 of chromatin subfamily A